MVAQVQQDSLWAWRSLVQKDAALRTDVLREPPDEYMVPASAGLVSMVCQKLGVEPTRGKEGDEVWRHLRGRPTARLYELYVDAKEAAENEDPKEVFRLIRAFGQAHEDALSEVLKSESRS